MIGLVLLLFFLNTFSCADYDENYCAENYLMGLYLSDVYPKYNICELAVPTEEQMKHMASIIRSQYIFRYKSEEELINYIQRFARDYDQLPYSSLPIELTFFNILYSEDCVLNAFNKKLLTKTISQSFYNNVYNFRGNTVPISFKEVCNTRKTYLCIIEPLQNKTSLDPQYVQNLCNFTKTTYKNLRKAKKKHPSNEKIYQIVMDDPQFDVMKNKKKIFHLLNDCFINKFIRQIRNGENQCDYHDFDNTKYDQIYEVALESGEGGGSLGPQDTVPDHDKHLDDFILPFRLSGKDECPNFEVEDDGLEPEIQLDYEPKRSIITLYFSYIAITFIILIFAVFTLTFVFVKKYIQKSQNVHFDRESIKLIT